MNQLHLVTNEWTINGTYTGEVRRIGRTKDFELEGKGTLTLHSKTKKTMTVYTGSFKDDKKCGYGKQVTHSENDVNDVIEIIEGFWKENQLTGNCFVWRQDGSRFHGIYYKGKRDGNGTEKLPDGRLIEGTWKNG